MSEKLDSINKVMPKIMPSLNLRLFQGTDCHLVMLSSLSVIETTLNITLDKASLPTLVSIENIICKINESGFKLVNSKEIDKIAKLVNGYYLVNEKSGWQDQSLNLNVIQISDRDAEIYDEIKKLRTQVMKLARDVAYYESKNDYAQSKQLQDNTLQKIADSVKSKPSWWDTNTGKIVKFVGETTLNAIIDIVVGIPLKTFVDSLLRK